MAGSRRRCFARRGRLAARRWRRLRPLTAVLTVIALSVGIGLGSAGSASAAGGPAVVSVQISPVDSQTGVALTDMQWATHNNEVGYQIAYSCASATCLGTTISLSPPPTAPSGVIPAGRPQNLLSYKSWTPPFAGATITGDDATGKVVHLGDLAAGASKSFTVVFGLNRPGRTAAPLQYVGDLYQLAMSATIDATNSTAAANADAAPVTWHMAVSPGPTTTIGNPGGSKPDVNVGFGIYFNSGAENEPSGGAITGAMQYFAAGSYTVVDQLPLEAELVSVTLLDGTPDPLYTYDSTTKKITWSLGSAANPDYWAGAGWGSGAGTSPHSPFFPWVDTDPWITPRAVTVKYPAANFAGLPSPPDANGCNFSASVTNTVTASATYLDPAKTTKSTGPKQQTYTVQCWTPFGQAEKGPKESTSDTTEPGFYDLWVPPSTTGLTCPASGRDDWGRACTSGNPVDPFDARPNHWATTVYNEANIPGVAVITDDALDQAGAHVTSIGRGTSVANIASVQYTLNDGTTGTANATTYTAPAGKWITKATVTSQPIPAAVTGASNPTKTKQTFSVLYNYAVDSTAPIGQTRTNTAHAVMTYPATAATPALPDIDLGDMSASIKFITEPFRPLFVARQGPAPVVSGGGTPVPGTDVTFSFNGEATNRINGSSGAGGVIDAGLNAGMPDGHDITPEYVFLAPPNWTIPQTAAPTFDATTPPGVQFHYGTVTIGGQAREVVVATWPNTTTFGDDGALWPNMRVVARPTAAAGNTAGAPLYWVGDSRNQYNNSTAAYFTTAVQNTVNVNGDGRTSQWFAQVAGTSLFVSGVAGMTVVKSICQPDASQPDGCNWISTPGSVVGVSTTATDIKYRITVTNTGSAPLSNVKAYDVLPYPNDTGVSQATSTSARGSTFQETVSSVPSVSAGVALAYSTSTNPCRPEVFPDAANAGCVTNWNGTIAGAQAIRATVATLAVNQSASFIFDAAVAEGSLADALGCNSVAVASQATIAVEPQAVCASTQQADLEITAPDHLPLQVGRPGTVSFSVVNHGGSAQAPASVSVEIPAGLAVTGLNPAGYACSDAAADSAPITGPVTLTCLPQKADGTARTLAIDAAETLTIPVVPDATAETPTCVHEIVSGPLPDPNTTNNEDVACYGIVPITLPLVTVDKTDGATTALVGDLITYQLTVASHLTSETIKNSVLTDTLPAGETFVSASDGGTPIGQTVTWNLADLNPTGSPNPDGSDTSGGAGASITVSVTVRVDDGTKDTVLNEAGVSAVDPAGGPALTDGATDTDTVLNAFTDGNPHEVTPQNQPVTTALSAIVSTTGAPLDPAAVTQNNAPAHGSISIDPSTGAVTYSPAPGYSGPDAYQVQVCDLSAPAQCHVSTVTVTVGVNVVTAVDDTATTSALMAVVVDVTGNDLSQSGQSLAAPTVPGAPAHGSTTVLDDGQISYQPDAGFSGMDTFTYQVCDTSDPTPVCDGATVTVTVSNVFVDGNPMVPTAQNVPVTTALDDIVTTLGAPVDPTTVTADTVPAHGSISIDPASGAVTYSPNPGYTGPDSYQVQVCDTTSPTPQCHVSPVSVTVAANVVHAVDDTDSTTPAVAVATDVRDNDTSASGQALANPTVTTDPGHGSATVNAADGTITYTPDADWSGVDTYTYAVCDTSTPTAICDSATVTVTVPNEFTDANPAETTPHDTSITTALSDIVSVIGAPLDPGTVTLAVAPQHGTIAIDPVTGAVTYTPTDTFAGPDAYQLQVCDTSTPTPSCHTSNVTVTVGANTVDAVDDSAATVPATAVTNAVLGNDTTGSGRTPLDPASVTVTTDSAHGTTSVDTTSGKITYTPDEDWSGVDTFGYEVCDTSTPEVVCDSATVTVTVDNVFTDGPAAEGIETAQNAPLTTPLDQIVSTAGAPVNPAAVTTAGDPAHGSVSIDPTTGAVTYSPVAGYSGLDSFDLQVCDTSTPDVQCHTVTIPVQVLDNAVTAADLDLSTRVNTDITGIDVLASATSASGQPLADPTITDQPAHGTATVNQDGSITYSPATDFDGTDSFTYTVCDTGSPKQACATATISVTVTPVANLSTAKKLDSAAIVAGLPVTYTTTVNNLGPSVATNVHSIDPIKKVVTHPNGTPDPVAPGGSCLTRDTTTDDLALLNPAFGPYTRSDYPKVVDCTYPSIPAGTSIHDTIAGTVDPAALPGATIVNQAPVFADTYDPDLSDNIGSATGTVTTSADVELTKRAGTSHASIGDNVTFTLTVVNHGPSVAADVVVSDRPTGMTFVSANPNQGTFAGHAGTWTVGTLAVGQTVTADVVEKITATGAHNVADVASTTTDPTPTNDGGRDCRSGTTGCGFVGLDIESVSTNNNGSSTPEAGATASTGLDSARMIGIALLLVLAGAGALTLARRRRTS